MDNVNVILMRCAGNKWSTILQSILILPLKRLILQMHIKADLSNSDDIVYYNFLIKFVVIERDL